MFFDRKNLFPKGMELPIFLGVSVEIQVKVKLRNEETQNTKLTKKPPQKMKTGNLWTKVDLLALTVDSMLTEPISAEIRHVHRSGRWWQSPELIIFWLNNWTS